MADVISIGANMDAIELVQTALDALRSGNVIAVAVVMVDKDMRTVSTGWSRSKAYHQLNSGAARLSARLATAQD